MNVLTKRTKAQLNWTTNRSLKTEPFRVTSSYYVTLVPEFGTVFIAKNRLPYGERMVFN